MSASFILERAKVVGPVERATGIEPAFSAWGARKRFASSFIPPTECTRLQALVAGRCMNQFGTPSTCRSAMTVKPKRV